MTAFNIKNKKKHGFNVENVRVVTGVSNPPENVSSRIAFLALLMLSVFVLTSYSAIIVSLLQTSSEAINTLAELTDSGFQLSMRDIVFNANYSNVSILNLHLSLT